MSSPPHAKPRNLLIFDDGRGRFGPLTDLRAAFELRTGAGTTRQRIEQTLDLRAATLAVPAPLAELRDRCSDALVNELPPMQLRESDWLLVSGRWPGVRQADRVTQLPPNTVLKEPGGDVVAAHVDRAAVEKMLAAGDWLPPGGLTVDQLREAILLARPWHIQDELERNLQFDLAATTVPATAGAREKGKNHGPFVQFGQYPLHLSQHATVQPTAVFNTEQGPIVVEYDALIGAAAVIEGPAYIGPSAQVTCHTHVRPSAVVGPMCKVGGEISHSIIFGHSNKAHPGYLGHAIVGEWVNLVAQTNVSNLKNTYGPVSVQLERDAPAENTGRTYLGPVIGDYVRTAIGTRILTGSVIGTGAMLAISAFSPKLVERFAFLTDKGGERYDLDKFIDTANRMMARRDMTLSPAEESRLRALFG